MEEVPGRKCSKSGTISLGFRGSNKRVKFTEQLTTQVQAGQSERLVTYLNFIGKCPKYSRRDRILIASLAPEATIVRGYNDWEKDGFQVRYMNKDPS